MRLDRSGTARLAGGLLLATCCTVLAGAFLPGCQEGRAPYNVLPERGVPTDYLPPAPPSDVAIGSTKSLGLFYNYDRTRYRLLVPLPGTDPRFIRGDSVLAIAGATQAQRLRPDLSDPNLRRIYDNPRLFGFLGKSAPDTGLAEGPRIANAHEYFPTQTGNWYEFNHNSREWIRADTLLGPSPTTPPTAAGMPVHRVRSYSTSRPDLGFAYFRPPDFPADVDYTSAAGTGVLYHAWSLIAERVVHPDLRGGPRGEPSVQRNPRFLWLSIQSLGFSDPSAPIPTTIDQCLDALNGFLSGAPLRVLDAECQVGEIYTTWTYVNVARSDLLQRINSEPPRGRCGSSFVVEGDTLRMFPTNTFSLLAKFEVRVERAVNSLSILRGGVGPDTVAVYSAVPGTNLGNILKLVIRMSLRSSVSGQDYPVQYIEMFVMRNFGEVVRRTGIGSITRSTAYLRTANVAGRPYPPTDFRYRD